MPPYKFMRKSFASRIFSVYNRDGKDRARFKVSAIRSGLKNDTSSSAIKTKDEDDASDGETIEGDSISQIDQINDLESWEGSTFAGDTDVLLPDQLTDTEAATTNGANNNSDGESQVEEPAAGLEEESDDTRPFPDKESLIKDLMRKAAQVRYFSVSDWHKQQEKTMTKLDDADKAFLKAMDDGTSPVPALMERCPLEGCGVIFKSALQARRRHVMTHYPDACFCPVCLKTIVREDSLDRHFQNHTISDCLADPRAARYHLSRTPTGKIKRGLERKYFNIYYLGAMDDFNMPDDHFQLIARRKRHAPVS